MSTSQQKILCPPPLFEKRPALMRMVYPSGGTVLRVDSYSCGSIAVNVSNYSTVFRFSEMFSLFWKSRFSIRCLARGQFEVRDDCPDRIFLALPPVFSLDSSEADYVLYPLRGTSFSLMPVSSRRGEGWGAHKFFCWEVEIDIVS
ncbi:hypothetical protein CDAR_259221 [Caerostris darwini]|uniref:Uncharacterized protein n=1 Tax=Caerostris darwini TaxID=1538125 RepID=A0AAV4MC02_9ARAC|nr:hypothetical protein CDAR_259221 [Caerostris darwini]